MYDTDKPDSILKQVPLIRNPIYQPPKPVTLNTNYSKLIPTLSSTVVPPKLNISQDEITSWLDEIRTLRDKVKKEQAENEKSDKYKTWVRDQTTKVAPGFNYSVMQPHKPIVHLEKSLKIDNDDEGQRDDDDNDDDDNDKDYAVNELDKLFGKTTLG
ncbi:hypothetical protein Cantr_09227 [Candida viswanathii]|uniref:Uncharacterized protein n=1 Tax=Candida viswanathii TaxID=5486 RepID=A0A367YA73_9ASCO|nr:hypothetical protein Cantr_09227 [Candida viswanathii]